MAVFVWTVDAELQKESIHPSISFKSGNLKSGIVQQQRQIVTKMH